MNQSKSDGPAVDQEGGGGFLLPVGSVHGPPEVHQRSGCRDAVVWPRGVVVLRHVTCRFVLMAEPCNISDHLARLYLSTIRLRSGRRARSPNTFIFKRETSFWWQNHNIL